jgi:hypothetical protein
MVKITNVFGDRYSGQAGHAGVFAFWKGIQYRRSYVIPSNPNTTKQQAVRNNLSNAVAVWHLFDTLAKRAYAYMAANLAMSGFNLFCKRWQLDMPTSAETMIEPAIGIKCIGHTLTPKTKTNPAPTNHSITLGFQPNVIGTVEFTKSGDDEAQDAYIEIQQGYVRIPVAITKCDGAKGLGNNIAPGDQLVISYTSSGRTVTREILYTVPDGESSIPAAATMALALRTEYAPIDYGSVVIEVCDVSETPDEYTQLESMEVDSVLGKCYYDMTDAADASSEIAYDTYTPIEDVKLEAVKSDTTFISWRDYSDENGQLPLAFTHEDETFDLVFSKTGHTNVVATAKPAALAALTEFVDVGVPS